ncbi:MAG: glycosyl hydrolase 115 family protein [Prevotellaceae bacterium]|jgi:hypothetical protein|nr:glycosyl hydrolase 115 family protein [Prevotellaceae bacterium]
MGKFFLTFVAFSLLSTSLLPAEQFVFEGNSAEDFPLITNGMCASIVSDDIDGGVKRAVNSLYADFRAVSGNLSPSSLPCAVIIGTAGSSEIIDKLINSDKISKSDLHGKTEKFIIQTVDNPTVGTERALVIAGSDKRGTIYGIYELSAQIGVSPWYFWADVPVERRENLFVRNGKYTDNEPSVRWRGIFINDEAPALSAWAQMTYGGFNHHFYEKVFELILRLKGNFLWPAMWGSAFYADDAKNGELANEMGIIIGASHHEPMGRAHDEWRRAGGGAWNYQTNKEALNEFWRGGMQRIKNWEKAVTIGMRGDGDEPMSEEANIALLEEIVKNQRSIIQEVTGQPADATPQVWALYKEVQDYYDKGMRVPDDVTLLLCDDNWGNVRKLPDLQENKRTGGYGMYYHFDYVGAPRNYKWLNISQIQRIWEQMNLTYEYGVDKLWVVNVGDLKPMEFPISFFLDMAWNPKRFNASNLMEYTEKWCAQQFGRKFAKQAAELLNTHNKYVRRVSPELLDQNTYSLENYNEWEQVVNEYKALKLKALELYYLLPENRRDAFDQLVAFPINAVCNLYEMYFAVAKNHFFAEQNDSQANFWAEQVKYFYHNDSILTAHYHEDIAGGKWNFMMSQTHIGYADWQQPEKQTMPKVQYVSEAQVRVSRLPQKNNCQFSTVDNQFYSVEAQHFTRKASPKSIEWTVIPHFGKTLSGVTAFPVTKNPEKEGETYLEYDFKTCNTGVISVYVLLAPTLNFNANKGLRYALSIDGGEETIVNFNGHYRGELGEWQAKSIITSVTTMQLATLQSAGNRQCEEVQRTHTLRIRVLDAGIVLEKIMLDFGGLKPSYLGAPSG